MNKQINKHDYLCKIDYYATCVFFIHDLCFMCFNIYFHEKHEFINKI